MKAYEAILCEIVHDENCEVLATEYYMSGETRVNVCAYCAKQVGGTTTKFPDSPEYFCQRIE
jgi:hypothetical protein